jgi:hypothetical protein
MSLLNVVDFASFTATRRLAVTTLLFAALGFVSGFLLSLSVAAYSLYVCTAIW